MELDKHDYFLTELYIDFKIVTNMNVHVLSGYDKEHAHTAVEVVEQGQELDFPIFNKTWIIATPKEGHNYTRLKFEVFIERNVPIWHEKYSIRNTITIVIIIGGVLMFIFGFLAYVYIKKLRAQMKLAKSKAMIVPTMNMSHDQTHLVHQAGHEISQIEFDEGHNKTIESPKGMKQLVARSSSNSHQTPHH